MLNEDFLTEHLSGESKKKFLDFCNAWGVVNGESNLDTFIMGFRLGKWGMLYKDYLQKQKPVLFTTLLTQGKLYQYCAQIDTQSQQMFNTLVEQMIKTENITEQLKSQNQLEWVQRMNSIQERASEIVCKEIIYV